MVAHLPRLVLAAPSTGSGKTIISSGLMAALRNSGLTVSGHKVGPDYIDPGFHALATGRPGRNLDPHLVGEERIVPLLLHGARGADIAVVEGVMGLFDGRLGTDGFASTAHVARLTQTPVVLVLDVGRASRTIAAVAAGLAGFDPAVRVGGVILNRAGSTRNTAEICRALEGAGLPVVGIVPRRDDLVAPSRHLGLVTAAELPDAVALVERLGEHVGQHVDLTAVVELARTAPVLPEAPWEPAAEVTPVVGMPVVAMASGAAFTFRYPETAELLTAAGCRVVEFDPLADPLPEGTRALYLGGGFPEEHAHRLAANAPLLAQVREAIADGLPTVAECAGLLYLGRELDGVPMVGALPTIAAMAPRLTLRYPSAKAVGDDLLSRAGEVVTGHEFHRTTTDPSAGTDGLHAAWTIDGADFGFCGPSVHASYLHVHWAGHPRLAQRLAEAAARSDGGKTGGLIASTAGL